MMYRVTGIGGGLSVPKQVWIKYVALLLLAIVAFGVAALALATQRGTDQAVSTVATSPSATTLTATASPIAAPTPSALPTARTPRIQLPEEPVLLVLGDSYAAGVGADQADQGWAHLVANSLGYPTNINGVPGTGFAWGGGEQVELASEYEVRLQEISEDPSFVPNVLILQAGQNDSLVNNPGDIESATARTIESARQLWPGVEVVVLGPLAPQPFAQELIAANDAVRAGAATANAPYIDANAAGWFTDNNSAEFDFDGFQVNTAGHRHIAEKFLESWSALIE